MKNELPKTVNNYFNDFLKLLPSSKPKPKEKYISSPAKIKELEIALKKKEYEKR